MNSTCKLAGVGVMAVGLTAFGLVGATAANAAGLKPVGQDDYFTMNQGETLVVSGPGILANDSDPEADPIYVGNAFGFAGTDWIDVHFDGSFTFTPKPDQYGQVSFAYYPSDGQLGAQTAVHITIVPTVVVPPVPLVANGDSYSTAMDTVLTVPASAGLLANDQGGPAYMSAVNEQGGEVVVAQDGSFVYTPAPGFVGTKVFGYRSSDGFVDSNDALVTITVTGPVPPVLPPVAPTANPDAYSMAQGTVLSVPAASGLLANDSFPGGSLVEIDDTTGEVVAQADGSFVYTPAAGFAGLKEFAYRMTDGTTPSVWASVAITVKPTIPQLPPTDPPTDPIDPTVPVDPTDPTDPIDPIVPPTPSEPTDPTDPIDPTVPIVPSEPTAPTELTPVEAPAVRTEVAPIAHELPTLAYTGTAAPRTWLLAPALGALGLGGLGLWIARRREQHSR